MSSPMMKRMLGFDPGWAEAGRLAIVVAVHSTTRAPQIVLNKVMVASSVSAAEAGAAAFAHLYPPTVFCLCRSMQDHIFEQSVGRLGEGRFVKAPQPRYALSATTMTSD